jgi:hypothetical protein
MSGSYGWTSSGWTDEGDFRVWKHYTGPLVAVHDGYEGDHCSLLSQMSEYLEDEAGIEREPTEAEQARERRDAEHRQTYQDMQATILRLDAENTELRRKLGETSARPAASP